MSKKFFHVTEKRNLPLIMKEGLIPHTQHWNSKFKVVFFWGNLEVAKRMCCEDEVILKVDVPEEYEIGTVWNEAIFVCEYFIVGKILPYNIRVISASELEQKTP